jgi:hypothetical protein
VRNSARTTLLLVAAFFALAVLAAAPAGSAGRLHAQVLSIGNLIVPAGRFTEGTVQPARAYRSFLLDSPPVAYRTADGMTVYVSFSDSYTPDPVVAQSYVNLLGFITHSSELNGLQVFIYTPAQIQSVCGDPNAEACYGNDQMFIRGTAVTGGAPVEQVLTHEYGHHIAAHRLNTPWPALDWGPKRWANDMNICANVADSKLFPGDEGANYTLNPGEGWAEAYRKMNELRAGWPDIGWNVVDQFFIPDATDLQLINLDVTTPWAGPTVYVASGRLHRKGVRRFKKALYDGPITARVTGPRGTTVALTVRGRVVRGPARRVSGINCGLSNIGVVVRSRYGGRFHIRLTLDDS